MGKGYMLDQLRLNRTELKKLKTEVIQQRQINKAPELESDTQQVIGSINDLIKETRRLEQENSNVVERIVDYFLDTGARAGVHMVVDIVGDFVDRYLNQKIEKTLIDVSYEPPRLNWGIISAGVKFGFSLKVGLEGVRQADSVAIQGSMHGEAYTQVDIGLGVKLTVPVIKVDIVDAMIRGGLRGALHCDARAKLVLKAVDTNLKGGLDRTIIDTSFEITAFLLIPKSIRKTWDVAVKVSLGALDTLPKEISKKLGSWELFRIVIPGYLVTFNMRHGKFEGGKVEGNFALLPGADVVALQKRINAILPWD